MKTSELRYLISQAKIEAVINGILEITTGTDLSGTAMSISNSYHKYANDAMIGVLDKNEDNKIFANITARLLTLLNEYDTWQNGKGKYDGKNIVMEKPDQEFKNVFISYSWGNQSELIVNQVEAALHARGLKIIRDKHALGYGDSIRNFMDSLGKGKCIIIIISDKYLKSKYCLYELLQIAFDDTFVKRVFPIILEDADIYDPVVIVKYVYYWEQKISELEAAIKTISSANLQGIREDIDLYTRIRAFLPKLTNVLKDMNALTPETHVNSNFTELYNKLVAATHL